MVDHIRLLYYGSINTVRSLLSDISHLTSVSSHISHLLVSFRLNLTLICLSVSVPQRSKLKILSTLGIIAILGYTCMHSVCN